MISFQVIYFDDDDDNDDEEEEQEAGKAKVVMHSMKWMMYTLNVQMLSKCPLPVWWSELFPMHL